MEFALIFPMVILLLVVVFDLGRAVYAQHTIGNAARGGARMAIVDQRFSEIQRAAHERSVGMAPSEVIVNFTDCPITTAAPRKRIGCEVEVRVTYQFQAITPLVGALVGPMTLESVTRVAIERIYPPPTP